MKAVLASLTALLFHSAAISQEKMAETVAIMPGSSWVVLVSGENRARLFRVSGIKQSTPDAVSLDATYGWADGNLTPVKAEVMAIFDEPTLLITTQAESKLVATLKSNGTFSGTFSPPNNSPAKGLEVRRVSGEELSAMLNPKIQPAGSDVPASCASFIGGWKGVWTGYDMRWLWIAEINTKCTAKYSWGPERLGNLKSAEIKEGELKIPCGGSGGACFFTNHGDELWGRYAGSDGYNNAVFRKVTLEK